MYEVNKQEAELLRSLFGFSISIYRTCKQKSERHRYLCSEEEYGRSLIQDWRSGMPIAEIRAKYAGRRKRYKDQEYEY